jgi:hypothetical protein
MHDASDHEEQLWTLILRELWWQDSTVAELHHLDAIARQRGCVAVAVLIEGKKGGPTPNQTEA